MPLKTKCWKCKRLLYDTKRDGNTRPFAINFDSSLKRPKNLPERTKKGIDIIWGLCDPCWEKLSTKEKN